MADVVKGTTFSWNGTAIPKITSFSGPGMATPILDVSDLDDSAKEKISSALFDGGQLTLSLNFEADDTVHDAMVDDCIAGNSQSVVMEFQNGTSATNTYSFTAFVTNFTPSGNTGEQLLAEVTLDITCTVNIA